MQAALLNLNLNHNPQSNVKLFVNSTIIVSGT